MGSCASTDDAPVSHQRRGSHRKGSQQKGGDIDKMSRRSSHAVDGDSGSSVESEAHPAARRIQVLKKNLTVEEINTLFFDPKKAPWLGRHVLSPEPEAVSDDVGSKPESKTVELLPEKEELRLLSWYRFLAECPQAIVAIRTRWLSITGQELDIRVTLYCNSKQLNEEQQQDRWRRYIMQQLVVDRGTARGKSISGIDDAYLRVVANQMSSEELNGSLSVPRDTPRSDAGGNLTTGSLSGDISPRVAIGAPTRDLPNLPELYGLTITGELFEGLMREMGLTQECHLMYLFSRLLVQEEASMAVSSPLTSPRHSGINLPVALSGGPQLSGIQNVGGGGIGLQRNLSASSMTLVRMVDQWSISLTSWRLGWLLLGCGGRADMQHKVELMKREFDQIKLQDQEFSKLYLFLWSFANSENIPVTAGPTPVQSSRNSPEPGPLQPPAAGISTLLPVLLGSPGGPPPISIPLLPAAGTMITSASPTRKVIPKDDAISIWTTVVATKWVFTAQWCEYCEDQGERIGPKTYISLDQWKQLLEFMPLFTTAEHFQEHDGAMSSWPGVLDDFAEWMQRRGSRGTTN